MVIVDSSVLIHFIRIGRLSLLKSFFKKIKITADIYEEIKAGEVGIEEFERACREWISVVKARESSEIKQYKILEKADISIILLAKDRKDILFSNDYAIIITARSEGVECLWPSSFILRCLEEKIITKGEARKILRDLINSGMWLRSDIYAAVLEEIEK